MLNNQAICAGCDELLTECTCKQCGCDLGNKEDCKRCNPVLGINTALEPESLAQQLDREENFRKFDGATGKYYVGPEDQVKGIAQAHRLGLGEAGLIPPNPYNPYSNPLVGLTNITPPSPDIDPKNPFNMFKDSPKGLKYDNNKPRPDLIPPLSLMEISKVMAYGAKKYGENNWRHVTPKERYIAAAMRHIIEYQIGNKVDSESRLSALAHAATSLMMLLELEING